MAIVMFAPSLTVCEIFAKQDKCQNFDLENESHAVKGRDWCHSTGNIRIHITYFFRIIATWEHSFTQIGNTQTEKR